MAFELLVLLALTMANGLFSGTEIAVLAVRKTRLKELAEAGSRGAAAVLRLRDDPERFLATVQVGITVIGTAAAAYGGHALEGHLRPLLEGLPGIGAYADKLAFALVVALVSFLSLVLGELVPKSLALRSGERFALLAGRPMALLSRIAHPAVAVLTFSSNLVLRLFGDRTNFIEARLSQDEIQQLVEEAAQAGTVDRQASEIASRALDFTHLTAADVMVPRARIRSVPRRTSREEFQRILLEESHARMPVHDGSLDNMVGFVTSHDAMAMLLQPELFVLEDILRPVYFVPETTGAGQVLRELQRRRTQLAIVVDEHGAVAGLLTFEDLTEELVGEILNEDEAPPEVAFWEADRTALVQGEAQIREVNRALGLELPESDEWSTVAGLCIALAGAIPPVGKRLKTAGGTELEVVEATAQAVRRVRIRSPAPPQPKAD